MESLSEIFKKCAQSKEGNSPIPIMDLLDRCCTSGVFVTEEFCQLVMNSDDSVRKVMAAVILWSDGCELQRVGYLAEMPFCREAYRALHSFLLADAQERHNPEAARILTGGCA